ncbi:MAG: hypothetical protein J4G05_09150 [Chlorobi bacterium]|nr:hypothetical protein [Chlorobiota bacterium]
MIYRLLVLPLLWFSHGHLAAQIYPVQTDLQKHEINGPVQSVITTTRTYSPGAKRWQPLVVTVVSTYNGEGNLIKERTFISHKESETRLFTYDKESDSLRPIIDATPALSLDSSDPYRLIMERVYSYLADDRIASEVERNYQTRRTLQRQYIYVGPLLRYKVEQDSSVGSISSIEEFFYMKGYKPRGSTIRRYNPATDRVTSLEDTASVPENRVQYDYTSYVYGDTSTPVIFWKWGYGADTIVDHQEVKRFLENGKLVAITTQQFADGKITRSRSQIFNKYGDPLSTADSHGNDTVYQRAFVYIYDKPDRCGNWREKRQYVVPDPNDLTNTEQRLLLSRVDRVIRYFEE